MMNIKIYLNKLYYKYIDTSSINHYRLLLITEEYIKTGEEYFYKYPSAVGNSKQKLFETNKQAKIEYIAGLKKQNELEKIFFENREIMCKNSDISKDCIICSEYFQSFYVEADYHYGQCIENVLRDIIEDIKNIENN